MNSDEFVVVGIVSGVSKKSGKAYTMLHCLRDFVGNNSQLQQGQECLVQFFDGSVPNGIIVGSIVVFDYRIGFGGKPTVSGVRAA